MLLSPRTVSYVEAIIREGDDFDYRRWLQRVREEEAQTKRSPTSFTSGEPFAPEIGDLTDTPDRRDTWPNAGSALHTKTALIPKTAYRSDHEPGSNAKKIRLRQRLVAVCDAWDDFQECRKRASERNVDNKTISKWARALRYAAHCKKPRTPLKTFFKKMGGINALAERYARYIGRGGR
jgi:hypothetical protein